MFLGCQERLGHLRHLENRVKETDSYCRFHCRLHPWFVKELSYILAERPPPSPWRNSIAPVLLCLKSQGWEQLQFPKEQAAPSLSPNPTQPPAKKEGRFLTSPLGPGGPGGPGGPCMVAAPPAIAKGELEIQRNRTCGQNPGSTKTELG